ncbi:hypothetical protein C4K05_4242 [Pseudomonas chlororaphis subsp. aureofaciens]|nr:hypothetical protein C4K05_4242 [Pseudomonas chlororaphis subsp. aureofaciens]
MIVLLNKAFSNRSFLRLICGILNTIPARFTVAGHHHDGNDAIR